MIKMNFLLFLGLVELTFIFLVIAIIQNWLIKKYKPYYQANTRPEIFLRKYLQRLITQTRKFGSGFEKLAAEGDQSAYKTRQNMTARLNWLILERDFATTNNPDIRYWEDLNKRIKKMLKKWVEVEFIKEPPDLKDIKLAIDDDNESAGGDGTSTGSTGVSGEAENEINELKKRLYATSRYETMYKEMDVAYEMLDNSYNDLKKSLGNLELEANEADKLRELLQQQEAQEQSLEAMMDEMEASKQRLSEELEQLGQAYDALEVQGTQTAALDNSDNPDTQEIMQILNQQESLINNLKSAVEDLKLQPEEKEKLNKFTTKIEKSNKEVNHTMQMLELERERLSEEVESLQKEKQGETSEIDDDDIDSRN